MPMHSAKEAFRDTQARDHGTCYVTGQISDAGHPITNMSSSIVQ
jgi:hypothetical protein